ncbi:hypothetical protein D3C77_331740 [compost metagenome]
MLFFCLSMSIVKKFCGVSEKKVQRSGQGKGSEVIMNWKMLIKKDKLAFMVDHVEMIESRK